MPCGLHPGSNFAWPKALLGDDRKPFPPCGLTSCESGSCPPPLRPRQRRCLSRARQWKHTKQRRCLGRTRQWKHTKQRRCLGRTRWFGTHRRTNEQNEAPSDREERVSPQLGLGRGQQGGRAAAGRQGSGGAGGTRGRRRRQGRENTGCRSADSAGRGCTIQLYSCTVTVQSSKNLRKSGSKSKNGLAVGLQCAARAPGSVDVEQPQRRVDQTADLPATKRRVSPV